MATPLGWQDLAETVAAIGALGTASVGLVDATKWCRGGVSNLGYKTVLAGLTRFAPAFQSAIGEDWEQVFRAGWLNGKPKDEQVSLARNFVRLGLSPDTAPAIAAVSAVDPKRLTAVAKKIQSGEDLTSQEFELIGRMDAAVAARLGATYDRADQIYRNSARVWAGVVAVMLSLVAWATVLGRDTSLLGLSVLSGLVAVPVAPIVKDLISALGASVNAAKTLKSVP